jgi:protein-arginine kinase activator protein McsA
LHITEVLGEDRFEAVDLCEDCAKKYLYEPQQKKHAGKTPRRAPRAKTAHAELAQLRQRLQALVVEENYEEAARVRDRIKELEEG